MEEKDNKHRAQNNLLRYLKAAIRRIMRLPGVRAVLSEKLCVKVFYLLEMDRKLDLRNPKSFSEKLQWLKLYDHNPLYPSLADKLEVRKYIADKLGEAYLIPLLGVYEKFEDIDFHALPDEFILKCTHDSGGLVICKNKEEFDKKSAHAKLKKCLKKNYYYLYREWPYKNLKPKIICEPFLVDESGTGLIDYKVFCFHGVPRLIQLDIDRFTDHKRNFYTPDWELIDVKFECPNLPSYKRKPQGLDEMLQCARLLSQGFPHIRVDFYCIKDKVYFGEMTFYNFSGYGYYEPRSFGRKMGDWLDLPEQKANIGG